MGHEILLKTEKLGFAYPNAARAALSDVELELPRGAFLLLCGPSGGGKTTLLRQLKPALAPHGTRCGRILFSGQPLELLDARNAAARIGFVQQQSDNQIVTDKVWHELAFGLESLGLETAVIRRRVAETAAFFGIESWFHRDVDGLSGGQKQLLNLASVMAMQPELLLLDEPTAMLDPIAASEFLSMLERLNRELGITVILSEHRLEDAMPRASAVALLSGGRLLCNGPPAVVGAALSGQGSALFSAMPAAIRIWAALGGAEPCPVTVQEGRDFLRNVAGKRPPAALPPPPERGDTDVVLRGEDLCFRYTRGSAGVLHGLNLSLHRGEMLALLGGNGAGKTTALRLLAGLERPERGRVRMQGKCVLLPQNPQTLFCSATVRDDLLTALPDAARVDAVARVCRLEGLMERHPYDLSGGEQQRAALAKALLSDPDVLLLDEPTKGLDAQFKAALGALLGTLLARGKSILLVSHDVEFCARYAHRCALLFDGAVAAEGTPRAFFSGNCFYTTAANRIARALLPEAVTVEDVVAAFGGQLPPPEEPAPPEEPTTAPPDKTDADIIEKQAEKEAPCLTRRAAVSAVPLLLVPLTLLVGQFPLGGCKYYFIALLVLLECMASFFLAFEGRRPHARELVTLAVLSAIGVAGRAVFFMLPEVKPVTALAVITGAAYGGEAGFLTGAVMMLVSNLLFSQGPWTPWQMFAMGLVGFGAGLLFHRRRTRNRAALCAYGAAAAIAIYGGIMNPAAALLWTETPTRATVLACYISGFPMDCVHAAATWLFLWLAALPMLQKLDRIRTKYGLFAR